MACLQSNSIDDKLISSRANKLYYQQSFINFNRLHLVWCGTHENHQNGNDLLFFFANVMMIRLKKKKQWALSRQMSIAINLRMTFFSRSVVVIHIVVQSILVIIILVARGFFSSLGNEWRRKNPKKNLCFYLICVSGFARKSTLKTVMVVKCVNATRKWPLSSYRASFHREVFPNFIIFFPLIFNKYRI